MICKTHERLRLAYECPDCIADLRECHDEHYQAMLRLMGENTRLIEALQQIAAEKCDRCEYDSPVPSHCLKMAALAHAALAAIEGDIEKGGG